MNASNAKDFLPLVQALAEGKSLQYNANRADQTPKWEEREEFTFDEPPTEYRIKPEPREIWVNEWADGKRIFDSQNDASLHAMQYPLVRSTTRYREVIE